MENDEMFDELCRKTMVDPIPMDELYNLWGHVFALPQWLFIGRGEFPDIQPYVASNAAVNDNNYMVRAFTSEERLTRFVKENNLAAPDGSHFTLSMPSATIIDYLESLIPNGVQGLWFNSDHVSDGFFAPIERLRWMKESLESRGWTFPTA